VEAVLKEAFGEDVDIEDNTYTMSTGTALIVPVATIRKPSICLFTNYNGAGKRSKTNGELSSS